MVEESGPQLPSEWAVNFYVNLRREKQSYKVSDFRTSNLKVCEYTSDLDKILRHLNAIPSILEMVQGSVSVFRDGIENIWEDPRNEGGAILRFVCYKLSYQNETGKNTVAPAPQQAKYPHQRPVILAPYLEVEKIVDLWKWLCAIVLSSSLEDKNVDKNSRAVNGIYCKVTKEGLVTFEIWFSRHGSTHSKHKPVDRVCEALTKIFNAADLRSSTNKIESEHKPSFVTLSSTFKIIDITSGYSKTKLPLRS